MPPGQEVMDILIVDEVPHTCSAEALDDYKDKEVTTDMPSTSKTTGSICKTPVKEKDLDNPDVPSVSKTWESHTPQKLKTPMSKKLRINRAWQKITHLVNANNTSVRTAEQLRIKYENLKAKARKVVFQQKCTLTGTGGGPGQRDVLDPVLEAILEIITKKTVVGIYSPWDSDKEITGQLKTQDEENESHNPLPDIHFMPLGQEVMDILIVDEVPHTCSAEALDDYKDKEVTTDMPSTSKTWESHTPQKLKTPMSKKLRINRGSTKSMKDKFYEKKYVCGRGN
nr:unnamed protein product [Callosobruchus analis]